MLQERSASPLRSLRRARPFGSSHGGPDLDDGRGYLVLTENRRKMSRTSPQPACYSGHVPALMFSHPLQPFVHSSAELRGSDNWGLAGCKDFLPSKK